MKTTTISGLVLTIAVVAGAAPTKSKSETTIAPGKPTSKGGSTALTGKPATGAKQATATASAANSGAGNAVGNGKGSDTVAGAKNAAPGNKSSTTKACPNFNFKAQKPLSKHKTTADDSSAIIDKQDTSPGSSHRDGSKPLSHKAASKSTSSHNQPTTVAKGASTSKSAAARTKSNTTGKASARPASPKQRKRWMIPDDTHIDNGVSGGFEGFEDSYGITVAQHTTLDVSSISSMAAAISRLTAGMNDNDVQTLADHTLFNKYLTTSTSISSAFATPTTAVYQYDDAGFDIHIDDGPGIDAGGSMVTADRPDETTIIVGQHTKIPESGIMPGFEGMKAATAIKDPGDIDMAYYGMADLLAKRSPIPRGSTSSSTNDVEQSGAGAILPSYSETPAAPDRPATNTAAPGPAEPVIATSSPAPAASADAAIVTRRFDVAGLANEAGSKVSTLADSIISQVPNTSTAAMSTTPSANARSALSDPFTGKPAPAVPPEAPTPTLATETETAPVAETAVAATATESPALNPSTGLAIATGTASGSTGLGVEARNTGSQIDVHPRQTAAPIYHEAHLPSTMLTKRKGASNAPSAETHADSTSTDATLPEKILHVMGTEVYPLLKEMEQKGELVSKPKDELSAEQKKKCPDHGEYCSWFLHVDLTNHPLNILHERTPYQRDTWGGFKRRDSLLARGNTESKLRDSTLKDIRKAVKKENKDQIQILIDEKAGFWSKRQKFLADIGIDTNFECVSTKTVDILRLARQGLTVHWDVIKQQIKDGKLNIELHEIPMDPRPKATSSIDFDSCGKPMQHSGSERVTKEKRSWFGNSKPKTAKTSKTKKTKTKKTKTTTTKASKIAIGTTTETPEPANTATKLRTPDAMSATTSKNKLMDFAKNGAKFGQAHATGLVAPAAKLTQAYATGHVPHRRDGAALYPTEAKRAAATGYARRRAAVTGGVNDNAPAATVVTKRTPTPTTMLTMPSIKRYVNTAH